MEKLKKKVYVNIALTVLAWLIVVGAMAIYSMRLHSNEFRKEAMSTVRSMIDKDIAYRLWNARMGGVYVSAEVNKPNTYLKAPHRDITTTDGKKLTLINPAYMTRQVHGIALEEYGVKGHITSLNPIRPENKPDEWERKALEELKGGGEGVSGISDVGGVPHFRMIRPLITQKSCLQCHSVQGYSVGDLRGGISASVPVGEFFNQSVVFTIISFIVVALCGTIMIVVCGKLI